MILEIPESMLSYHLPFFNLVVNCYLELSHERGNLNGGLEESQPTRLRERTNRSKIITLHKPYISRRHLFSTHHRNLRVFYGEITLIVLDRI